MRNPALMVPRAVALAALVFVASCAASPDSPVAPATADAPTAPCGSSTQDWCPSPEGDPCGEHADEASCRADARCVGMPYVGESLVACKADGNGYWTNCPAVGCVSKPAGDAPE
jgi:hypothetical protein